MTLPAFHLVLSLHTPPMTAQRFYLRPTVQVDPLVHSWYAHPYLIAPATRAQYIANAHLPIMKSFVRSPQAHVAALRNPEMLGGPFIQYPATRQADIEALRRKTETEAAQQLELAQALKALYALLRDRADGTSLESLYASVPEQLRGLVELKYDVNHQPGFRLFERLLYASPLASSAGQSVALTLSERESRPFVLSTPRLPGAEELHLRVPFSHPALDALFAMRTQPAVVDEVARRLEVPEQELGRFRALFQAEPPRRGGPPPDAPRARYFGHACVAVESPRVCVLVDPWIAYGQEGEPGRFSYADLPERIDFVLITHAHVDHAHLETLLQLRHRIGQIIVPVSSGAMEDPSLKLVLESVGFRNVREVTELERVEFEGGWLCGVPFLGEHGDLDIRTKQGYFIHLEGKSVLLVADSRNIESRLYARVRDCLGPADVVFVGMECKGAPVSWLYGPFFPRPLTRAMDQSRRLNGSDSQLGLSLVHEMGARRVFCYALGAEPWLRHIVAIEYNEDSLAMCEYRNLEARCAERGVASEKLFGRRDIPL
nr:putative beta-hydroxylase [Corallococcus coralloides]